MERPRSWPKSILFALIVVYLPTAVPFVVGPLTECSHCVATYLRMTAIMPGVVAGLLFMGSNLLFYVVTGATTLAILISCLVTARRLSTRALLTINLLLMLLLGLEACSFAGLLRA